jgi:hypothetical protein
MGNTAKKTNEKRDSTRNPAEIGIVCQPYSSTRSIRQRAGILRNYSSGGIYLEIPHGYKPGTILVIRTTHSAQPISFVSPVEGVRTICLAEVKWQQDLSDQTTTRYGMGLGYLNYLN